MYYSKKFSIRIRPKPSFDKTTCILNHNVSETDFYICNNIILCSVTKLSQL